MDDKKPFYSERSYNEKDCCVFRKTKEKYGGLSNMASGFPLIINSINIYSSEALYQACRFPHLPDVQKEILAQKSPMTAKMKSKPFRNQSREDWEQVKIKIMQWCLRVKLAQNFLKFGLVLEETYFKSIVEDSSKDDFWGAKRQKGKNDILVGVNALGRLLMELREKYFSKDRFSLLIVEPPAINNFTLLGNPIKKIDERDNFILQIKGEREFIYTSQELKQENNLVKESSNDIKVKKPRKSKKKKNNNDDTSISLFNN